MNSLNSTGHDQDQIQIQIPNASQARSYCFDGPRFGCESVTCFYVCPWWAFDGVASF